MLEPATAGDIMRRWIVGGVVLATVLASSVLAADLTSVRRQWQKLQDRESAVLAPKKHERAERAMVALESAAASSSTSLPDKLETAQDRLDELEEAMTLARTIWAPALRLRERAREAGADTASASWTQAENILLASARKLEAARQEAAERQASPLPGLYDQARLEAMKFHLVGGSQEKLVRAEKEEATKYTPRSYVRALDAVQLTEELLDQSSGEADMDARDAAERAAREAEHTLYLLENIRNSCESANRARIESVILEWEAGLQRVLETLGQEADFRRGMGLPLQHLLVVGDQLLRERNHLRIQLAQRSDQVDSLQHVIQELKVNVGDFEGMVAELAPFREEANTVTAIQSLFTQTEGRVLLDNRDLVLRLHGLRFASAKADIPPQSVPILDKVAEAVRALPGAHIVVEGHTDSSGRPDKNKRLSEERARAVRVWLIQEAGINPSQITAIGYGSSRPVASNDTADGRSLNRRIEITISRPG
jgi:outer membrane protein OmpA-like peptidoglycan-associated protein